MSGLEFSFDPLKEKLKRINPEKITVNGEKIILEKVYNVSLREYIHEGYDGYDILIDCPYISNQDDTTMLIDIINEFFKLVSKFSIKEKKENIQKDVIFGHDSDLKILDYINEISVELVGELSLRVDFPSRINIEK